MKLDEVIAELKKVLNKIQFNEMAQKQGQCNEFIFYTLDNEYVTHKPHVHICISNNNKHWKGKSLRNGSPYKTVGSITLNQEKYTLENLAFEEVLDNKIENINNKKLFVEWLNSNVKLKTGGELQQTNANKCLNDYLNSNY